MMRLAGIQVVILSFCRAAASPEGACALAGTCGDDPVSLMQLNLSPNNRGSKLAPTSTRSSMAATTCSDLRNQGAYFTVNVGIGSPKQNFQLVADTGSDALIIPDCRCVEAGYCSVITRCFAPEDSSSFALDEHKTKDNKSLVMGAKMDYGSGEIQVLIGTDHVDVAGMKTRMHHGVFLMEDRRSLDVHGEFEGILGLGLPHNHALTAHAVKIPSFMDESKDVVKSYSLCFREWPHSGALATTSEPLENPMTNLGEVHWGLGLEGFSVGDVTTPAVLCSRSTMPPNQQTPCGAIPDSGTTLLMGPADHIHVIYSELCESWPRCKKLLTNEKDHKAKSKAFHTLLRDCESWMSDDEGISEVPSVFIHLIGSNNVKQRVELSSWSYIVETTQEMYHTVSKKLFGWPVETTSDTPKLKRVCTASFGPQDYNTPSNGPVWILGSPTFYANTVGYSVNPPAISFKGGGCKSCSGTSLLATEGATPPAKRPLRQLSGNIMEKRFDLSNGL